MIKDPLSPVRLKSNALTILTVTLIPVMFGKSETGRPGIPAETERQTIS